MKKDHLSENSIISLIFSVSRNLRQKSQAKGKGNDQQRLSLVQLETLKFIDEHKHPLMKEVAEYLFIAPPSLTTLIDGLEKRGFVRRGASTNDRRAVFICLTRTGKTILQHSLRKKTEKMQYVFSTLSDAEQKTLIKILEKLSE